MTFGILSGLAIIMVVAGHLGYNILTLGDLFPYYSFHVPLFMFMSGYFYKETEETHPFGYVERVCHGGGDQPADAFSGAIYAWLSVYL